jgi:transcriptional regulator with XRE-family HTH domain
MDNKTKSLGVELRTLREQKNLSLRELARRAGISPAFLSKVERGEVTPPAEQKLRALAKALGCDSQELLALSGRIPPQTLKTMQRHAKEWGELMSLISHLNTEQLKDLRNAALSIRYKVAVRELEAWKRQFQQEIEKDPDVTHRIRITARFPTPKETK